MDEEQLRQIFEEVQIAHKLEHSRAIDYYFDKMHTLAEMQYPPAKEFFLMGIEDHRSGWRELCLKAIGFHYDLSSEEHTLNKIRQICLSDENDDVRLTAIGVLDTQSRWPEPTLISVLQGDTSMFVRLSALEALLSLANVPPHIQTEEINALKLNGRDPDVSQLKRIIAERGPDKSLVADL